MIVLILLLRLTAFVAATIGAFKNSTAPIAYGIFLLLWANTLAWNDFASKFVSAFKKRTA